MMPLPLLLLSLELLLLLLLLLLRLLLLLLLPLLPLLLAHLGGVPGSAPPSTQLVVAAASVGAAGGRICEPRCHQPCGRSLRPPLA